MHGINPRSGEVFLPLAIDHDHANQALPLIKEALNDIAGVKEFDLTTAFDKLITLMSCTINRLARVKEHQLEHELQLYSHLHHILLFLSSNDPLPPLARESLSSWLENTASEKNLGKILICMALLPYKLSTIRRKYIKQGFANQANSLAALQLLQSTAQTFLRKSFEETTMYQRTTLAQFCLLNTVNRPPGKQLTEVLDGYHRRLVLPDSNALPKIMSTLSKQAKEVSDWVSFFRMIDISATSERIYEFLSQVLRNASNVKNTNVDADGFNKVIRRKGHSVKRVAEKFDDLPNQIQKNLQNMNIRSLYPLQRNVLKGFSQDYDPVVVAPVGCGKTTAAIISALHRMLSVDKQEKTKYFFLVVPEQLTARHVYNQVNSLVSSLRNNLAVRVHQCNQRRINKRDVREGRHIFVGPPRRLERLLTASNREGVCELKHLKGFFLLEADTLLDQKFHKRTIDLLKHVPQGIRCGVFC